MSKIAYLWIADFGGMDGKLSNSKGMRLSPDLFFSSKEKFNELCSFTLKEFDQLVQVKVPDDFNHWDFIPDNY